MIITVYNFKGGQGKSKISLNLALTMGYGVITNDEASSHELILSSERILKLEREQRLPTLTSDADVIFDLGGFIDDRVVDFLRVSDVVLVPVVNENDDEDNIRTAIKTIDSIQKYTKKIVIIANKTELKRSGAKVVQDDLAEITRVMTSFYPYSVLEIKRSRAMGRIAKERRSIREMVASGGVAAYAYAEINKQFDHLIEYLMLNYSQKTN